MADDIVRTGARHVNEVRDINRDLIEKSLQMRCLAYLSQVKAQLLTETIFEVDHSKKNLKQMNLDLAQHNALITRQKGELEKAQLALEEKNRELERFNKLFVERELRIKELRQQVKALEDQLQTRGPNS